MGGLEDGVGSSGAAVGEAEKLEGASAQEEGEGALSKATAKSDESSNDAELLSIRRQLSHLPRQIHRCLDDNNVHGAAAALIALFEIISSRSTSYPLASALSGRTSTPSAQSTSNNTQPPYPPNPPLLETQMKMIYLHVQTLPTRTVHSAKKVLLRSAAKRGGAQGTAAALSALDLLDVDRHGMMAKSNSNSSVSSTTATAATARATKLIDLYYDSKARLLNKLLDKLSVPSHDAHSTAIGAMSGISSTSSMDALDTNSNSNANKAENSNAATPKPSKSSVSPTDANNVTNTAEHILSKIVLILQYDVILYPYMIFVLRKFPVLVESNKTNSTTSINSHNQIIHSIMSTLPQTFDRDLLKSKASRFLAAHLPLIRTKVKSVLRMIAGTTASKLGQIRQSLYDKTDGGEFVRTLALLDGSMDGDNNMDRKGICTWEEAVSNMVDIRVVSHGTTFAAAAADSHGKGSFGEDSAVMSNVSNGQGNKVKGSSSTSTSSTSIVRFSLWSALFSTTFSSLVHSLLTTSFHSVHSRVVSTLRTSLARAPPFIPPNQRISSASSTSTTPVSSTSNSMLPHEAHRNALRIATDLDLSLRRVSDDAHELLVHAEEREESERRLRQSLYVQTCEIMGRLLNELRRMLLKGGISGKDRSEKDSYDDATKELIVGRLCHLLKFRLQSLPTLLDPQSSPAVLGALGAGGGMSGRDSMYGITSSASGTSTMGSRGMITLLELSSSFDLADDDDDGLISFDEAMEAMESAFSGTQFHGAEMVRDTLLLSGGADGSETNLSSRNGSYGASGYNSYNSYNSRMATPQNVTLSELALLSARGLRHAPSGPTSALGTVQSSLDAIVNQCFKEWARAALAPSLDSFGNAWRERVDVAKGVSEGEWRRLHGLGMGGKEDDAVLREIGSIGTIGGDGKERKEGKDILVQGPIAVGQVSPHVVSYLLTVATVFHQSVCPADSLPPVPSLEYAERLGISLKGESEGQEITEVNGIANMMCTIRASLLAEAVTSMSKSLKREIISCQDNDDSGYVESENGQDSVLKQCSPSSLIQLLMDVQFIHKCFFERNHHGFATAYCIVKDEEGDTIDIVQESKQVVMDLSQRISSHAEHSIQEGTSVNGIHSLSTIQGAISERHLQVFSSCDLFLSSLFGEDEDGKFSSATNGTTSNGISSSTSSSSALLSPDSSLLFNPLTSSRRFILLPIQAEKSLAELQLRKYGKKAQEEKGGSGTSGLGGGMSGGFGGISASAMSTASGNALGTGFGFLSSMLSTTKNR